MGYKFIIVSQNVVPYSLEMTEEQLEKWNISPDQGSLNPHPSTSAYSSLYFPTTAVFSGVSDCVPSCSPVLQAPSLQGEIFIDQVTGDT